jgi:hypothetical protein
VICRVVVNVIGEITSRDAVAAEENVFTKTAVGGTTRQIGFIQNPAIPSVPIDFPAGLLNSLAVAVVGIGDA